MVINKRGEIYRPEDEYGWKREIIGGNNKVRAKNIGSGEEENPREIEIKEWKEWDTIIGSKIEEDYIF